MMCPRNPFQHGPIVSEPHCHNRFLHVWDRQTCSKIFHDEQALWWSLERRTPLGYWHLKIFCATKLFAQAWIEESHSYRVGQPLNSE
ncbi:hypothetical protein CBM2609_A20039 [Cupriavidus taiwanensis]|nr:hypothetical protein CBM2604_A20038 [Cupriavidus taiwanensis]SOZ26378.1 hypothetical protein CBM2609_A20039 [Cupriavidus taiwanensis]SOZ45242.1 hypothetical protein CBM2610_A20028 [Cupriavidus taiwanensis]